jgi:type III secretion protein N (ATPase)
MTNEARSTLGHPIILLRKLVAMNQYPAVDVLWNVSRILLREPMNGIGRLHQKRRIILSKYQRVELLVGIGEYEHRAMDEAIEKIEAITSCFRQELHGRDDCKMMMNKSAQVVAR